MGMIDEDPIYVMGYNRGFKNAIKASIPKAEYENRLKADMVDMLDKIKNDILEKAFTVVNPNNTYEYINVLDLEGIEKIIDKYKIERGN